MHRKNLRDKLFNESIEEYVINKGEWNEWRLGGYLEYCNACDSDIRAQYRFIKLDKIYPHVRCTNCGLEYIIMVVSNHDLNWYENAFIDVEDLEDIEDAYIDMEVGFSWFENGSGIEIIDFPYGIKLAKVRFG